MRKPAPGLLEIASRVISARQSGAASIYASAEAMQLCCGDLYRVLETAMGPAGLQALIARAIQIAARDHPWLAQVKVGTTSGCALAGLSEAADRIELPDAEAGFAALLATIVWLLVTFIGEELALRFLRQAWPGAPLHKSLGGPRE